MLTDSSIHEMASDPQFIPSLELKDELHKYYYNKLSEYVADDSMGLADYDSRNRIRNLGRDYDSLVERRHI